MRADAETGLAGFRQAGGALRLADEFAGVGVGISGATTVQPRKMSTMTEPLVGMVRRWSNSPSEADPDRDGVSALHREAAGDRTADHAVG